MALVRSLAGGRAARGEAGTPAWRRSAARRLRAGGLPARDSSGKSPTVAPRMAPWQQKSGQPALRVDWESRDHPLTGGKPHDRPAAEYPKELVAAQASRG